MRDDDSRSFHEAPAISKDYSLRESAKLRLLSAISGVKASQKIVILDSATVKIVDAVASMVEILDCSVFLVESIALGRQPYPQMAAVYILTPEPDSIAGISRDFTPPKIKLASGRTGPMYSEAHLFFTSTVGKEAMKQIATSPAAAYVKSFIELRLDFIPCESRVFHLTSALPLSNLTTFTYPINDIERMASQILNAFQLIQHKNFELPIIRYQQTLYGPQPIQVALRLQLLFEEVIKSNLEHGKKGFTGQGILSRTASGAQKSSVAHESATILLLNRSVDLISPLVHEFTLQAMATDLLDLGCDGTRYTLRSGTSLVKSASLDESDQTWLSLRHAHIADATNIVIGNFNKFLSENRSVIKSSTGSKKHGEKSVNLKNNSEKTDATTIRDLKDMMAALGEFQETKAEYALHISLVEACFAASNKKELVSLGVLEQNILFGTDGNGRKLPDQWGEVASWLTKPTLTSEDRARLVALYSMARKNVSKSGKYAEENSTLIQSAALEKHHSIAVQRILLAAGEKKQCQREINRTRGSSRETIANRSFVYESSRYIPAIKVILEDLVSGDLDDQEFPVLHTNSKIGLDAAGAQRVSLLSNQQPSQKGPVSLRAKKTMTTAETPVSTVGGPIFVFVMGGITYSEMRSVYEIARQTKREVFIGSTEILTPARFLAHLGSNSNA